MSSIQSVSGVTPPAPARPAVGGPGEQRLDPDVNRDRLVDTFLRLVQVPGSTFNERQIADAVKAEVRSLGFDGVEIKEDDAGEKIGGNAGNVIVNIPGSVPNALPILFSSHMDTVRLAVGVRPQVGADGIIRSDGTTALGGDDRAGISEILEALREVRESNLPHGPIQLVFTVAEEGGLLGSEQLDPRELKSRFGFVMDVFKANEFYTQGEHLLMLPPGGEQARVTAEMVHQAHTSAEEAPVIPPERLRLTPEENAIMQFAGLAMNRVGLEPTFRRLEWAGTDAIMLREKGMTAISLGAGENAPHSRQESVAIDDMVKSTRVVRSLIDMASRMTMAPAASAVGGPVGAALAQVA